MGHGGARPCERKGGASRRTWAMGEAKRSAGAGSTGENPHGPRQRSGPGQRGRSKLGKGWGVWRWAELAERAGVEGVSH
jgi:hypothetical protein